MRITNKIMRNNSLYNINQNKVREDHLSSQMTNQSKIVRPSDDPVVAIRALRLRSNVTTVSQYYDKNAQDADKWLTVTADALGTVADVLESLYKQTTDASNKYLTSGDLQIFVSQIESLTKEFYASGNVDYAGRFVFSGFRTDTPITFTANMIEEMKEHPVSYNIQQDIAYDEISSINYTDYNDLTDELQVSNHTLYRFRLAYDDLDENIPKITDRGGATITPTKFDSAEAAYKAIADGKYMDNTQTPPVEVKVDVAYIPDTGEIVFNEDYYGKMTKGDQFHITYDKSNWEDGDINPVHYFKCTETTTVGTKPDGTPDKKVVNYNMEEEKEGKQNIFYNVGYNQTIQVNTRADEVFTHDVRRDLDDFNLYLTQLKDVETQIADIEAELANADEGTTEYTDLQKKLDAAKKANTYVRENIHTKFQNQMTKYQKYIDMESVASTHNATRGSRLDLISSRLMNQKATFKDLQSSNEDIDVTQVAVELSSADLTYQAALMATSKIMQTNLMNYI